MDSNQQWFFLFEGVQKSEYVQTTKTFSEFVTFGISFKSILHLVGQGDNEPKDYNFFVFGESMKAAVQLLTDKSIFVTYRLYCEDDQVVTVIIRLADDPSPNSSQCPSAPNSLRERRRISGRQTLRNVDIRTPSQAQTKNIDAETLRPISELPASEKIILDLGRGQKETFSVAYLLGEFLGRCSKLRIWTLSDRVLI